MQIQERGVRRSPPSPAQPSPPTASRDVEGQRVLLDDAQHGLVGGPGVVGYQEILMARQKLQEGRAGARAQDAA